MRLNNPARLPTAGRIAGGSAVALVAMAVLLAATLALWALPFELVLPSLCVAALTGAFVVGGVAWKFGRPPAASLSYWDIAGALALIGMGAAMLSEPDQVLSLLDAAKADR
jgi:hypothetical protein